jgi:hypothetical protein
MIYLFGAMRFPLWLLVTSWCCLGWVVNRCIVWTSVYCMNFWVRLYSSVICHTTGPQPLPKRFLHLMRSRASSFKWEYPLLSPRSSSNFLRLLPRLRVTSIRPFIFPSITSFRRQFLRKIWPIQLAFRFLISCRKWAPDVIACTLICFVII